jgi:fatty acid desaturase
VKFREPPRLATWILIVFGCYSDYEAILGDLCERYQVRPSSIWYWRQTFNVIANTLMRNGAIFRIALWASAGFLVSVGWGVYFTSADKADPIPSIVYTLALLTQPIAGAVTVLYPNLPVGFWPLLLANVATYALVGFTVETIRQHYRLLQISK